MGNEASIKLKVDGADQAKAALDSIAASADQLGKAVEGAAKETDKATPVQEKAKNASAGLAEQHRTLVEGLRRLGPEFGVAADFVQALTLKQTASAAALGIAGAAVMALIMIYREFTKGQADAAQAAGAVDSALESQRQRYVNLTTAIQDSIRAQEEKEGKDSSKAPVSLDAAGGKALQLGMKYGMDEEPVKKTASAIRGGRMDEQGIDTMARWTAQGGGQDLNARQVEARVRAGMNRPEFMEGLAQQEVEYHQTPAYLERQTKRAGEVAAMFSPTVRTKNILENIAAQESVRTGETITPGEMDTRIGGMMGNVVGGLGSIEQMDESRRNVMGLMGRYPQAKDLGIGLEDTTFAPKYTVLDKPSEMTTAKERGTPFTLGEAAGGIVNHGGTVIIQDSRESRAGRPTDTVAR